MLTRSTGYGCDSKYRYGGLRQRRTALGAQMVGQHLPPAIAERYLYCEDDPVNAADPSGRKAYEWLEVGGGIIAGLGVLIGC